MNFTPECFQPQGVMYTAVVYKLHLKDLIFLKTNGLFFSVFSIIYI